MNRKGFTLIELLIVIAVIGILAGVFFIGVTGFRNSALDARRVADLKNVQNSLELYYSKCRLYPNNTVSGSNCPTASGGSTSPADYAALVTILQDAQIGITAVPRDPVNDTTYYYDYISDGTNYILSALLTGDRDVLRDQAAVPGSQTIGGRSISCYDASASIYRYCVSGNR